MSRTNNFKNESFKKSQGVLLVFLVFDRHKKFDTRKGIGPIHFMCRNKSSS